jgi:type II secretory pathway pseudopilin PulG
MQMNLNSSRGKTGMTLVEVAVALALGCLIFATILMGYVQTSDKAEWTAYALAAQSLAMQGIEQAKGGKWDLSAWPPVDEAGLTNYSVIETLDVPVSGGKPVYATNFIRISNATTNPPLREVRADCVWSLPARDGSFRGPFTNTAVTLRARDQ